MAVQQITELATTHMTLGAHNKFNIDVNNAIIQATAAALRVENYATLYAQKIEEESRIVNRQTAMASTVDVSAADRQRDSAVGVIMNLTNAHTTSIIAEKADAAKKLRQLLAPYKGIGNHAYQKETAEINGMVAVLTTGDGATYAATLGMDDEVDALMQANAAFEEAYTRNQEEAATLAALQSVDTKELRAQVDALYQQIVLTVNAVAVLQQAERLVGERIPTDEAALPVVVAERLVVVRVDGHERIDGLHAGDVGILRAAAQVEIHALLGIVLLQLTGVGSLGGPAAAVKHVDGVIAVGGVGIDAHGHRAQRAHAHGHVRLYLDVVVKAGHIHFGVGLNTLTHDGHVHLHVHGGIHALHGVDLLLRAASEQFAAHRIQNLLNRCFQHYSFTPLSFRDSSMIFSHSSP